MPIILCTGHSDFINEKKARDIGIREFLMKPISMKALAHVVRGILDEKQDSRSSA
jgi:YesN/AraC family two-component response regulator